MNEQEIINEVIQNLRVDNPCPMLLARLQGSEKDSSYYCNSCKKEIIDFTNCSDEEIAQRVISDNICGIFYEDQLKGQHQVHYNFFQKAAFYFLVFCSSIGFNVTPINAQTKSEITNDSTVLPLKNNTIKDSTVTTNKEELKKEKKSRPYPYGKVRRNRKNARKVLGVPRW